MILNIETGVCGLFQLETFKCDADGAEIPGSRKVKAPWFKNLITDAGLNRMGSSPGWKNYCQVGSGSTPPNVLDTALSSRIAGTDARVSSGSGAQSEAPYYGWSRVTVRFSAGVAAGNISEVGMGWESTGSLFSRALVLDQSGSPTTITVLADEYLDVTYEFRQYPPLTDAAGVITLAGVEYSYITRAAGVVGASWAQSVTGDIMGLGPSLGYVRAYNGEIGPITGLPSGSSQAMNSSVQAYENNSLSRKTLCAADPSEANLSGGISALHVGSQGSGAYQVGISPPIPKNANNTLNMTVSYSWARKTL